MHNPSTVYTQDDCEWMSKSSVVVSLLYQVGYQQALDDFAIAPLLHRIHSHPDRPTTPESETIAAILIQSLTNTLTDDQVSAYRTAIRHHSLNRFSPLAKLHISRPKIDLPATFPEVDPARFGYGDRLCWTSKTHITDWGMVIGRFYSFAPHWCQWQWSYLIWLDAGSPSFAWVKADVAWEDDLEQFEVG